nr:hypothetical protein BaRGS_006637 [Batillaria attramentaria]
MCSSPTYWRLAQGLITVTTLLVLTSNILMMIVTVRAASTRINPYFFMSLAMSDLLMGLLVLPFDLAYAVQAETANPSHEACTFSGLLFHILQTISLFSFFALSLDRFLSIAYPLRYPTLLTQPVNVAGVVVIWSLPTVLYGVVPLTGLGQYGFKCWQSMCNLTVVDLDYLTFLMLLSVVVFLATYGLNVRIFVIAKQQSQKIAALGQRFQENSGQDLRLRSSVKAVRSIVLALGLFTLCWGPYYSALFSFVLFGAMVTPGTEFGLLWMAISNSFMNFFVFLATYKSFRMHFLRIMGRRNRVESLGTSDTLPDN